MWLFWYFLMVLALALFALGVGLLSNRVDSKIKAGDYRAALLKASFVTALALFFWVSLLLTPFNLASFKHQWWHYLAALLIIPGAVSEWQTARRLYQAKVREK